MLLTKRIFWILDFDGMKSYQFCDLPVMRQVEKKSIHSYTYASDAIIFPYRRHIRPLLIQLQITFCDIYRSHLRSPEDTIRFNC